MSKTTEAKKKKRKKLEYDFVVVEHVQSPEFKPYCCQKNTNS
jgi:hypothetical protein